MRKYNVGDKVRVLSKHSFDKWMEGAQERIYGPDGNFMNAKMQELGGHVFTVSFADDSGDSYTLGGMPWSWSAWMFDPDFVPEKHSLSFDDAVKKLLAGNVLYDAEGNGCLKGRDSCHFVKVIPSKDGARLEIISKFDELYAVNPVSERIMTQWEALAWASSERSFGWVVRMDEKSWFPPQQFGYDLDMGRYQRARIKDDLSGIDEATIQPLFADGVTHV
jgi:hypothetical protein